jgi:hypothetical protein
MMIDYLILQIIECHVTVEYLGVVQTVLGKAVIIIPRTHLLYHLVDIALQFPLLLIILEHGVHILFIKTEHGIEPRVAADAPVDIVAAGHVVQRDRTDSHHEDAVEHALKLLEIFTIEATLMSEFLEYILALFAQYHIGEIVIFINDEI